MIKDRNSGQDNREFVTDVVEWDAKNWWRAITFWDEVCPIQDLSGKKVLDIGGRNGGLSLYFALKGADVICSDISEDGFDKAKELHRKYNVQSRISYEIIDATKIPYGAYFDIVCFKSVIGGVGHDNNYEKQKEMISSIYYSLKKDGVLLFAENLKASVIHQMLRETFAKKNWRYISLEEALELTSSFSEASYKTFGFLGVLGRNKWLNNALSAIDNLFDRHLKEQYKYIVSCVCRK